MSITLALMAPLEGFEIHNVPYTLEEGDTEDWMRARMGDPNAAFKVTPAYILRHLIVKKEICEAGARVAQEMYGKEHNELVNLLEDDDDLSSGDPKRVENAMAKGYSSHYYCGRAKDRPEDLRRTTQKWEQCRINAEHKALIRRERFARAQIRQRQYQQETMTVTSPPGTQTTSPCLSGDLSMQDGE